MIELTSAKDDELYAELCDVICRDDLNIPANDQFKHTSKHARKVAMDVMNRLQELGYLKYVKEGR